MERKAVRNGSEIDTLVEVGSIRFGHDPFPAIAGPRAIESEEQIMEVAEAVAEAGAALLRGGVFESSSSPYAFPGLGEPGLKLLQQAGKSVGLPTMTKALEPKDVDLVADRVDMIHVDPGSMQNFELLRVIGRTGKPVLLERGASATVDEWLWAAEYILAEGNDQIVLCEGGIRTFAAPAALDLGVIPVIKEKSHLPVIVAPSAAAGSPARIQPLALAAQGVGADGIMIEVHPDPGAARTRVSHQLTITDFTRLMDALGVNRIRMKIDLVNRDLVRLLANRDRMVMEVGRIKAERGMPVQIPEREEELLALVRDEAVRAGLDPDHVEQVFALILEQSREVQRRKKQAGAW